MFKTGFYASCISTLEVLSSIKYARFSQTFNCERVSHNQIHKTETRVILNGKLYIYIYISTSL